MWFFKGIFQRRLNRFVVECVLNGKETKAHLPNPGRLWELLIPKRTIYLRKRDGSGLPYTVWATEREGSIICLNTHFTNRIAERLLMDGVISELKGFRLKTREFKIKDHRIDILLERDFEEIPVEVKSCTLFEDSIAMFPDAPTERGRRHLELLAERRGAIIFIIHSPDVYYFLPDFHTDPIFSETLYNLKDKLLIKAVSIQWDRRMDFRFIRELSIPWDIYKREAQNKGSYIITGLLKNEIELPVGSLGRIRFQKGYYLYVGSAMNSLYGRLRRYLRGISKKRWHIDYLIHYLKDIKTIPIQSSDDLECILSKELGEISDGFIKKFGSSDCDCQGHLYFLMNDPFQKEEFINIILKYRIKRLKKFISSF